MKCAIPNRAKKENYYHRYQLSVKKSRHSIIPIKTKLLLSIMVIRDRKQFLLSIMLNHNQKLFPSFIMVTNNQQNFVHL